MSCCVHAVVQEPDAATSAAANLEAEADDLEVEDPGLYDLARRLTDNALEGEASHSPDPHATAPVAAQLGNGKTQLQSLDTVTVMVSWCHIDCHMSTY